jgi:hypothetical protein
VYNYQLYVDGGLIGAVQLYLADRRGSPLGSTAARKNPQAVLSVNESPAGVLTKVRDTLHDAQLALEGLRRDPDPRRQAAAFSNVVVWGRAVTNVLQQLRSRVVGFDDWYAPWKAEMEGDPLLKWLYRWRSRILKQGDRPPSLGGVDLRAMLPGLELPQAPPNATTFFLGDETGGLGWIVRLPDGSLGKIYLAVPEGAAANVLTLTDAPDSHLGARITDHCAAHIAELYLHYLERLVHTAETTFGPTSGSEDGEEGNH